MPFTPYKATGGFTPYTDGGPVADTQTPPTPQEAPSKKQGIFSRISDFADKSGEAYRNFNFGALKGFGSTALGAAGVVSKGLESGYNATIGKIPGAGGPAYEGSKLASDVKDEYLQPEGMAQKIGFGTEQIAEFLVPSTGAQKIAGAAQKVASGVAKKAPKIGKALSVAGTAVEPFVQAAGDVITTVAQRGQVDDEAKKAGLFSLAGGIAANTVAPLLKAGAELVASRALPATIKEKAGDVLRGRELGRRVLDTGVSVTRGGLTDKISGKVKELGAAVDGMVDDFVQANPGKTFSVDEIANSVMSSLDEKSVIKDLELIPTEYEPIREAITKQVSALVEKYGGDLDLNQVQKLKKELGPGLEKAYKAILERPVKVDRYATMQFQKNLKGVVDEAVPQVKPMNKKLGDFITARDRLFAKSAYSGYLTDMLAASIGASATGGLLEDPIGSIQNGVANLVLKRLGTSTLAKTGAAKILDDVNKILERPEFYQAVRKIFEKRPEASKSADSL